ncbi:MAG: transporter substrate-binding domain-containing protein [Gammaproteobacteria bacterium]|nr:transporter substrate-binding domain-containing protein [Gammaproteobacteria bacterium]
MLTKLQQIIIALSMAINVSYAETLTIRADYWYPMNGESSSAHPGYMIELARAIFEPKGVKVDYDTMPWIRAIQQTREGEFDCVVGAYKNDAPDFLFPNEHWGKDQTTFYVMKQDAWRYDQALTSLKNRQIGTISGYSYGKTLDQYFAENKVQEVSGDHALDTNIKKLLSGRIDTIIESEYVMQSQLSLLQLSEVIIAAGQTQQGFPMYFACGPNNPKSARWIELVNETLPKLKASGKFEAILHRYGISSW